MSADETSSSESDAEPETRFVHDVMAFLHDLDSESDRAAVILGCARLDTALYEVLVQFLRPCSGKRDDLFEAEGVLSSFSSKIDMAHRLRLIGDDGARALHLIRKIRNTCAHEAGGTNLESGAEGSRIRELFTMVRGLRGEDDIEKYRQFTAKTHGLRSREFRAVVAFLVVGLIGHAEDVRPAQGQELQVAAKPASLPNYLGMAALAAK